MLIWRHASSSSASSDESRSFTAACTHMSSVPPSWSGRLAWTGAGCRLVADAPDGGSDAFRYKTSDLRDLRVQTISERAERAAKGFQKD
jgi:hypothetical protein